MGQPGAEVDVITGWMDTNQRSDNSMLDYNLMRFARYNATHDADQRVDQNFKSSTASELYR